MKIDDLFVRPLTEPARSLDHLKHPERWMHWNGTACPLKKPGWSQTPADDFSRLAVVRFWSGKYMLRVGQIVLLTPKTDGWVTTTPEQIVDAGWRVD